MLVARRARALTITGALAAFAVGTLTYAAGTIGTTLLLLAFFVPSVALSRAGKARKRELVDTGKGGARDALQVLANGGVATVCIIVWALADRASASSLWFLAFAGAYAAATADTWGTEMGTLAPGLPRSIVTGKPLATGLSGGVTAAGTAAEIAGAVLIALVTPAALVLALPIAAGSEGVYLHMPAAFARFDPHVAQTLYVASLALPVFVAGFAGAFVDSLLGATLQDRRWCAACARECETNPHVCGAATERRRGLPWLSNDGVNFAATATGAAIAALGGEIVRIIGG